MYEMFSSRLSASFRYLPPCLIGLHVIPVMKFKTIFLSQPTKIWPIHLQRIRKDDDLEALALDFRERHRHDRH